MPCPPRRALAILVPLLLAACGSVSPSKLWPFGESETERSRKPANATEYRCAKGGSFYVRNLDANAVWLVAPDREIRLQKHADGRWSAGRTELAIDGDGATLVDPPSAFEGCKRAP
jgi:hypothetical protein